jgi:catechol 2,3-dioxygenase
MVGTVHLQVSQLPRSLAYYEEVLGFRVRSQTSDTALLTSHDDDRPLVRLQEGEGVRPVPRGATLGLYHFAVLLPDRGALGRFAAHLSLLGVHAGVADHAVSESFYVADPDGLGVEVYADRPRDRWRYRGRELVMTVDPLDISSLIEAGGDETWKGLPPGTTIGHMHLHVGDLQQAEAFYHVALGLDKVAWNFPGALFLSAGGYHHHLGVNTWARGTSPDERQARLLDWELVVPAPGDVSAAADSFAASGCPVDPHDRGFLTTDPWGTRLAVSRRLSTVDG